MMCDAGREESFDELPAWIFCPTLTRHSHLMSTHRGFFVPGDPGTPQLSENPGDGEIQKKPVLCLNQCCKFCCERARRSIVATFSSSCFGKR